MSQTRRAALALATVALASAMQCESGPQHPHQTFIGTAAYRHLSTSTFADCCNGCRTDQRCMAYSVTYANSSCSLFASRPDRIAYCTVGQCDAGEVSHAPSSGPSPAPPPALPNVTVTHNVTYAQGLVSCPHGALDDPQHTCTAVDLTLDVYQPVGASAAGRPAIVIAHGGGNAGGDKATVYLEGQAQFFAARGFVAFNIDYRLAHQQGSVPAASAAAARAVRAAADAHDATYGAGWTPYWQSAYPAVRDFKAAVRFVRANAAKYGIDPTKIVGSGGSAGATNALATGVTFDGDYKDELNATQDPTLASTHLEQSSAIQVVYTHWSSDGEIDLVREHDPKNRSRYSSDNPPVVEFHGDQDPTIPISHAYAVQAEYKAHNVPYELNVLKGCAHGAWGYGCSPNGCTGGPYCSKMDEIAYPFVMKHLGLTRTVEEA